MDISINQRFYNTKLIVALGIKNLFNVKDINRSMTNNLGHSSSTSMMPIGYGTSFHCSINFRDMKNLYITLVFFLYSCEQEEIGIDPHTQGERNNIQIELEQDYKKQVYYSIDNNEVTSENLKTE